MLVGERFISLIDPDQYSGIKLSVDWQLIGSLPHCQTHSNLPC
jgi:hypothetical protein